MNMFYVLLLGFAVSIDGFIAGIAYGLKNIRMPVFSLLIVGAVTGICTGFAMVCAYILGKFIDVHIAVILGSLLLIILGLVSLFQQYLTKNIRSYEIDGEITAKKLTLSMGNLVISIMAKPETADVDRLGNISPIEAMFLGLALAIDAMIATFGATLIGELPLYTPIAVAMIHMLCVASGCYSSGHFVSDTLKKKFPYLPGTILILLGLIRLG